MRRATGIDPLGTDRQRIVRSKSMRKHVLVASLLALVAAPLVAQEKGTIEFGGFVKYTRYYKSFGTSNKRENSYGGGARLGYFLSKHWELEADGSINATDVKGFFK